MLQDVVIAVQRGVLLAVMSQHKSLGYSLSSCVIASLPMVSAPGKHDGFACTALPALKQTACVTRLRHRMSLDTPRSFVGICIDIMGSELLHIRLALEKHATLRSINRCALIDGNVSAVHDAGSSFSRALEPVSVLASPAAMKLHARAISHSASDCTQIVKSLGIQLLLVNLLCVCVCVSI